MSLDTALKELELLGINWLQKQKDWLDSDLKWLSEIDHRVDTLLAEVKDLRRFKQLVLSHMNDTDDWDRLALYLEEYVTTDDS